MNGWIILKWKIIELEFYSGHKETIRRGGGLPLRYQLIILRWKVNKWFFEYKLILGVGLDYYKSYTNFV